MIVGLQATRGSFIVTSRGCSGWSSIGLVREDGAVLEPASAVAVIDTGVDGACDGVNVSDVGLLHDVADRHGHGSAVARTVRAVGGTRVVAVKAIGDRGVLASRTYLAAAFDWVLEHRERLGIAVVCASIGDSAHAVDDVLFREGAVCRAVVALREAGVPTVAAAGNGQIGNEYYGGPDGCAWPAILRETVSVGAAEHRADGTLSLRPSSQRVHPSVGTGCATTVFAVPGDPGGTSGAAAVVAGLLAARRRERPLDTVEELLAALLRDAGEVRDGGGRGWPVVATG